MPTLVHLIYIHGFQGNDTTFQSFPKHLQEHLEARIPQHLDVKIQSSLYPTYKSVKPISHATKNFLEWLSTQPPGPVILMGHSMGGLLAADAATDPSNNPDRYPGGKPKRIVGVVAFDTPYLGMHPHVVISGIASLLPKGDEAEKEKGSERAMNQHPQVNIIDKGVTDDWEAFKKQTHAHTSSAPYACNPRSLFAQSSRSSRESAVSATSSNLGIPPVPSRSPLPSRSPSPPGPSSLVDRALTYVAAKNDDPLVRWLRKHADEPFSAGKRWVTERFQFGICMFDPSGLKNRYSRLVEWGAGGGVWVNYWTTTVPRTHKKHSPVKDTPSHNETDQGTLDNNEALVDNGILSPTDVPTPHQSEPFGTNVDPPPYTATIEHSSAPEKSVSTPPTHTAPTKSEAKAAQKEANSQIKEQQKVRKEEEKQMKQEEKKIQQEEKKIQQEEKAKLKAMQKEEKEIKKSKTERHFVVTPDGLGQVLGGLEKWENVPIAGVEDEVNAHTGLFIPSQNLDYEAFVEKVANKVLGWCERLPKIEEGR